MRKVYENKDFIILQGGSKYSYSYILYNKKKDFKEGHTHITNYGTARWIMRLYQKRLLPDKLRSEYLLISFLRISDDNEYSNKIKEIIEQKKSHKQLA